MKEVIPKTRKCLYNKYFFVYGLICLTWVLIRTGKKPSRISYPCQQAAAFNANLWLVLYFYPLSKPFFRIFSDFKGKKVFFFVFIGVLLFTFLTLNYMNPFWDKPIINGKEDIDDYSEVYTSNIFVVNNTNGDFQGVKVLLELMADNGLNFYNSNNSNRFSCVDGLIEFNDIVIIKVNCQWDERGGTNTDLVKAIIQAILDHPEGFNGEIIVADNGQKQYGSEGNGGNLDWENNNAVDHSQSIQEVVDFYPKYVSTYLWDSITTVEVDEYSQGNMDDGYIIEDTVDTETGLLVSYPKFTTKYGTYVSFKNGIWNETTKKYDTEKLKVINVPVLKTHCNYGVTGSVKHYMGIPSEIITSNRGYSSHNAVRTGGMGTLMTETRFPILNILDCIWVNANPLSGPMTEYDAATEVNIIAASTDPIALDYWASKNVLIKTCIESGNTQVSSMNPDKTRFGSFGNWLRLSMQEINRGGFNTTMVEENIIIHMNSAN